MTRSSRKLLNRSRGQAEDGRATPLSEREGKRVNDNDNDGDAPLRQLYVKLLY